MDQPPSLDQFIHLTYEKLRYRDTDRQGHVNNAVFATMLETGRAEILFDSRNPLYDDGCSFVIANLTLNFRAEMQWPGRVDIGTSVAGIGRSSVALEQALYQDGRCVATARSTIVQMNDAAHRSQPFSDEARQRLAALTAKAGRVQGT